MAIASYKPALKHYASIPADVQKYLIHLLEPHTGEATNRPEIISRNKPGAANPVLAPLVHVGRHWGGVADSFTAAFKWSAVLAVLAATFHALPCVGGEGATSIPPKGWTERPAPSNREGLKFLFLGRRTDRTGQLSTLVVSHVPQLTARK